MPTTAKQRWGVDPTARPGGLAPAREAPAPRAPAHICFLAPHAWPVFSGDGRIAEVGGAEVQQSLIARQLAAQGYRVSMICLDYGQPQRVALHGVTVHKTFRPQAGIPVLRFLHPRLALTWRAMREVDADIYYCRSASMWVAFVAEFCRRHGKRAIYAGASNMDFVRGEGGQIRYARDRWLYRRGIARVDRIVAQNETQRATCRATYGRDALIIPNLYEPAAPAAPAPRDVVLWVSTLRAGKHPERFLELAARLPHRRFMMVGGPDADNAALYERTRRAAAGLANLEFTGFLPLAEVERRFDRARVLVNTSAFEGMPNTFLQAWSRGVPTLASVDVGTPAHLRFATLEEAARRIEALFEDAQSWRVASRRCLEHFQRTHSSAQVLRLYERLIAELRP